MNTRVVELLKNTGLSNRIYNGDFFIISDGVSFDKFEEYHCNEERFSFKHINIALKNNT